MIFLEMYEIIYVTVLNYGKLKK